jgi:hypothetical protein
VIDDKCGGTRVQARELLWLLPRTVRLMDNEQIRLSAHIQVNWVRFRSSKTSRYPWAYSIFGPRGATVDQPDAEAGAPGQVDLLRQSQVGIANACQVGDEREIIACSQDGKPM